MREFIKNLILVVAILLLFSFWLGLFSTNLKKEKKLSLSQLVKEINEEKVKNIVVAGEKVTVIFQDGSQASLLKERESSLSESLLNLGVEKEKLQKIEFLTEPEKNLNWLWQLFWLFSPLIIFFVFFWFLAKQARTGAGQIFDFTRARAKVIGPGTYPKEKITFNDVAGLKEAKEELKEIVDFLKNPQKYLAMGARIPRGVLLVGPPGCGKCVVGDTFVLTSKGWVKIQDIPKYFKVDGKNRVFEAEVFSIDPKTLEIKKCLASNWYNLGKQKTIKITSQIGLSLEGTPEHPVVIWNKKGQMEFKPLKDIKIGDILVVNYNHQVFGNYKILPNKETAYLLGLIWGEGKLSVKKLINKVKSKKSDWVPSGWKTKEIPESILQGPKEFQVEFLRGLFDSNGFCDQRKNTIQIVSASQTLISQVQLLLLNLGIISQTTKRKLTQTGDFYHYLEISGDFVEKFAKEIGFSLRKKQKKLEKILAKKRNTNLTTIPFVGKALWKIFNYLKEKKISFSRQFYLSSFYKNLMRYAREEKLPTKFAIDKYLAFFKEKLPQVTNLLEYQKLEKLADNQFFFTKVVKIEKSEGTVYDFTVPKTHSFVANGFINHNTLLAKAVAGESNVPFFYTSGSSFTELFVGVGPSRVRNLFETAKRTGRAIIFIDEIDAIGKVRGFGISGGQEEREQTLNEILNQMDGFEKESGVIVMAASVTGDTPVLVRQKGKCKISTISEIIDPYYKEGEEGVEKEVEDLEVLGLEKKEVKKFGSKKNLYFGSCNFKKVRSVFRHRVKEIYEIEYLGGKIRATGNHSVFVRTAFGLKPKPVKDLKVGDVLVDIPFKVNFTNKEKREIRAFNFKEDFNLELPLWQPIFGKFEELNFVYQRVLALANSFSQAKLTKKFGFSQTTIGSWIRSLSSPREISKNYYQHKEILPEKIKVTPDLMRLFGYFAAKGYAKKGVDFVFNRKEKEKIEDVKNLMRKIFNLEPSQEYFITPGAVNIRYFSTPVGEFFAYHCGNEAKNKHLPEFLFEAPFEYFKEFLRGYLAGDGFIDKKGKGKITSASKRLILELNWLFRMHGFKSYILKRTIAWKLGFGKTQNPLNPQVGKANTKRPIVKAIKKVPFDGYVYDFCGCENEAFFGGENPILLHNTNKPEMLDPALLRPGRFDRRIVIDLPDIQEREEILKLHSKGKPLALNANLREIAERTPGFSGADLANLVNEAALLAARKGKKQIFQEDLFEAIEKVLLGPERKSHVLSKKEKEIAAYHESGHAIVSAFLKEAEPVRKISIIPRGLAAGYTLKTPTEERKIKTKSEFLAEMAVLLGGYCAEKLKFKEITTGAANDLERATELAKKLVMEYGMSDLGPITFGKKEELAFLGKAEIYRDFSEKIAEKIDKEVEKFVKDAQNKAMKILRKKKRLLERVAQKLIEKETIEREEFEKLIKERA